MKKLTQKQINKILEEHKHWLNEDCEGWEIMRADFSYCDLSGADLSHANLCVANLHDANLCDADLHDANLRCADLCGAKLCGANLSYADLSGAEEVPYIPMVCPEEGDFIGWKAILNYLKNKRCEE